MINKSLEEAQMFLRFMKGDNSCQKQLCQSISGYVLGYLSHAFNDQIADDLLGPILEMIFVSKAGFFCEQIESGEMTSLRPFNTCDSKTFSIRLYKK